MAELSKCCTSCGEVLALEQFSIQAAGYLGRRSSCKPCSRAYNKRYYRQNEDLAKAARARYRRDNLEAVRRMSREWAAANPERHRANGAAWTAANLERKRARSREWLAANRERHAATTSAWQKANADRKRDAVERRRARRVSGFVAPVQRRVIWERDLGICGICNEPAVADRWHLDHIVPLSRGGTHEPANVQVTHPKCNLTKGNRLMNELGTSL